MIIHFFFLLVSFQTVFADQKSCSSIDLRPELGPVRNQDGTGWCYAYSTSDLVSHKLKKRISPVDMALQFHKKDDEYWKRRHSDTNDEVLKYERQRDIAGGGFADVALKTSNQVGFCAEEKINENDFSADADGDMEDAFFAINDLNINKVNYQKPSPIACAKISSIKTAFPGLSTDDIESTINSSSLIDVNANLANKACEPRIRPDPPLTFGSINNNKPNPNEMRGVRAQVLTAEQFNEVNNVLSQKKPLAISVKMDKIRPSSDGLHGIHSMVLAGRKFNKKTGKCEFIFRNSWGSECSKDFIVPCDPDTGTVFIDEDTLKTSILEADYIK